VQKFAKQMQKQIESVPSAVMKGLTAWEWLEYPRIGEFHRTRSHPDARQGHSKYRSQKLRKTETEMAVDAVVNKKRALAKLSAQTPINAGAEE